MNNLMEVRSYLSSMIPVSYWPILVLLLTALFIALQRKFCFSPDYRLPPRDKGWQLIGLLKGCNLRKLYDKRDIYGDISYYKFMGKYYFMLHSIDLIREIHDTKKYGDTFNYRPYDNFTGKHLLYIDIAFNQPTTEWKKLKRLGGVLTKQQKDGSNNLEHIITANLADCIILLREFVNKDIDVALCIEKTCHKIIAMYLTGKKYDYHDMYVSTLMQYRKMCNRALEPIISTGFTFVSFIRFLPIKFIKEAKFLRQKVISDIFYNNKNTKTENRHHPSGIIHKVLQAQKSDPWLTDENVLGLIQDICMGGILAPPKVLYAFFLITLNYPQVQTNIQKEIDEIIDKKEKPGLQHRDKMPYTQASILELLRYASTVPCNFRACAQDSVLNGYDIPAKSVIGFNVFRINHDPKLWHDPWSFDPKRFLDRSNCLLSSDHPNRRNMINFGIGLRTCLGLTYTKSVLFLFIVTMLKNFTCYPSSLNPSPPSSDSREYIGCNLIHPRPYLMRIKRRIE